jgi:hypothetical protein
MLGEAAVVKIFVPGDGDELVKEKLGCVTIPATDAVTL